MSRGKLSPGRSSNTRSQEENRSRNKNTWKSRKLGSSSKSWIREGKRNARKEENEVKEGLPEPLLDLVVTLP